MKVWKITAHSLINVITNSSTEIFQTVSGNGVSNLYEILNEVLKSVGSDQKAEDIFEIGVEEDIDIDSYCDYADDDEAFNEKYPEYARLETWRAREDFIKDKLSEIDMSGFDSNVSSAFTVKMKDTGEPNKIIEQKLNNLFDADEYYEG